LYFLGTYLKSLLARVMYVICNQEMARSHAEHIVRIRSEVARVGSERSAAKTGVHHAMLAQLKRV